MKSRHQDGYKMAPPKILDNRSIPIKIVYKSNETPQAPLIKKSNKISGLVAASSACSIRMINIQQSCLHHYGKIPEQRPTFFTASYRHL